MAVCQMQVFREPESCGEFANNMEVIEELLAAYCNLPQFNWETDTDITITNADKGLVLTDVNGDKHRLGVTPYSALTIENI